MALPGLNCAVDPDAPVTLFPLFPLFPLGFKITSLPKAAVAYGAAHVLGLSSGPERRGHEYLIYLPFLAVYYSILLYPRIFRGRSTLFHGPPCGLVYFPTWAVPKLSCTNFRYKLSAVPSRPTLLTILLLLHIAVSYVFN